MQSRAVASFPSAQDLLKGAQAQAEAVLALPGLLVSLTNQVRALTEAMATMQRLAARAEGLLDELEPGVRRVAKVLDDPIIDEIPDSLREMQANLMPVMKQLRDTQAKVAAIADSTSRLASLPGAALFGARSRRTPEA